MQYLGIAEFAARVCEEGKRGGDEKISSGDIFIVIRLLSIPREPPGFTARKGLTGWHHSAEYLIVGDQGHITEKDADLVCASQIDQIARFTVAAVLVLALELGQHRRLQLVQTVVAAAGYARPHELSRFFAGQKNPRLSAHFLPDFADVRARLRCFWNRGPPRAMAD